MVDSSRRIFFSMSQAPAEASHEPIGSGMSRKALLAALVLGSLTLSGDAVIWWWLGIAR
jgi:hypothetical protein